MRHSKSSQKLRPAAGALGDGSVTKSLVYIALFAALIAAGAFIQIRVLSIPYTLQTFFCLLAGSFLGARRGAAAAGAYVLIGLIGLPIFTAGGGFQYVVYPSFGYLLGLVPTAFLSGLLLRKIRPGYWRVAAALFLCATLDLAIGALYYALVVKGMSGISFWPIFSGFFLVYLPAEVLKAAACAAIFLRLRRML